MKHKKMIFSFLLALMVTGLLLSGCKKKQDTPAAATDNTVVPSVVTITIPNSIK